VYHANAALTPRARLKLARLVIDEGWPVARAAERFQVVWPTAKGWADRYQLLGPEQDQPSRPHRSPNKTPQPVVRKIVHLRWKRRLGPIGIAGEIGIPVSPHHGRRLGIQTALSQRVSPSKSPPRMAARVQPSQTPQRDRESPADHPLKQPHWALQLRNAHKPAELRTQGSSTICAEGALCGQAGRVKGGIQAGTAAREATVRRADKQPQLLPHSRANRQEIHARCRAPTALRLPHWRPYLATCHREVARLSCLFRGT
jgi:hypothetical protein